MAHEIKGYQLNTCLGSGGCPNRVAHCDELVRRLEQVLERSNLLTSLKERVGESLKFHHELRVSIAECPNACSQPQIKDIGIIRAVKPTITGAVCFHCGKCVEVCPDKAIILDETVGIDPYRCMNCGKCIRNCPTGTIGEAEKGYRVLLGGKLGRNPRLARELLGILGEPEVLCIVDACITLFKKKSWRGKRFAEILNDAEIDHLADHFSKHS